MEKLVGSLTDYVELLTLGALLLVLPAISFKIPLSTYVPDVFKRAPNDNPPANTGVTENPVPWTLSYVLLFVILFSAGALVNAAAYWVLQPAHINVVHTVRAHMTATANTRPTLAPDWRFLMRPLPFWRTLNPTEYESYNEDGRQQAKWQIAKSESYGTYSGSVLERSIRLVRGVIALLLLFVFINFIGLMLPRRWIAEFDVRERKPAAVYHSVCIIVSGILYIILMNSYWWLEALSHREVWAASEWLP